ncbi:MAG: hypothetical protein WAN03_01150, partial [Candidatus Sulfotelmatobacter sp.]
MYPSLVSLFQLNQSSPAANGFVPKHRPQLSATTNSVVRERMLRLLISSPHFPNACLTLRDFRRVGIRADGIRT